MPFARSVDLALPGGGDFVTDFLAEGFFALGRQLGAAAPDVFLIMGNDDPRLAEGAIMDAAARGAWTYLHDRLIDWEGRPLLGYAFVPPSPFLLKDWERYDVSRYVDPGCVSPEEGARTIPEPVARIRHATIARDLAALAEDLDLERALILFHAPPYRTALDRADLDGQQIDHVPLDPHVGSIAIRRFIEERQPALTLHGHIHEAARLSGDWRERIGRSWALGGAHDGPELALVRFDPDRPEAATRELI